MHLTKKKINISLAIKYGINGKRPNKYIQNQLTGNWQDPETLPSGYNLSSLLVFVRESCGDYEASQSSKDNVRAHRNRLEKKGEIFNDVNNNLFKSLYNKHLTKVRTMEFGFQIVGLTF